MAILVLATILGLRIKEDWLRYRILKDEARSLIAKNLRLSEEAKTLERLKEDGSKTEVLEKEVREILGLKKEGENVALILSLGSQLQNSATNAQEANSANPLQNFIAQMARIWYNLEDFFSK